MRFARRLRLGGLAVALGLALAPAANALTCDWTGAVSSAWHVAGNWTNCGGGIPGIADIAVITPVANLPSVSTVTPVGGLSIADSTLLEIAPYVSCVSRFNNPTRTSSSSSSSTSSWYAGLLK